MLRRFGLWWIRRLLGGGARSWMLTWGALSGIRLIRRVLRPKPIVERMVLRPGDHLTLDQLRVSHRRQIKDMKAERRALRRAAR